MLKMILKAFGYEYADKAGETPFSDVEPGSWQARMLERAIEIEAVDATRSEFNPNATVTRAEAMKLLFRIGQSRSERFQTQLGDNYTSFQDVDPDIWYAKYFGRGTALGLTHGDNGNARPEEDITRADAAELISKTLKHWEEEGE